jgi:hypothetical protein
LDGLLNCCGIHAPGVLATISSARAIEPFMPFFARRQVEAGANRPA